MGFHSLPPGPQRAPCQWLPSKHKPHGQCLGPGGFHHSLPTETGVMFSSHEPHIGGHVGFLLLPHNCPFPGCWATRYLPSRLGSLEEGLLLCVSWKGVPTPLCPRQGLHVVPAPLGLRGSRKGHVFPLPLGARLGSWTRVSRARRPSSWMRAENLWWFPSTGWVCLAAELTQTGRLSLQSPLPAEVQSPLSLDARVTSSDPPSPPRACTPFKKQGSVS